MSGVLVLVVGPSGAGKDTLLAKARLRLERDPRFLFVRRYITRPHDAGGEDHFALSHAEYRQLQRAQRFALAWEANRHCYGLPASAADDLAAGRVVVANVSRTVIEEARRRFARVRVVVVDAPLEVLAKRLAHRGREHGGAIAERLERAAYPGPRGPGIVTIVNDGSIEDAVGAFLAVLYEAAAAPAGRLLAPMPSVQEDDRDTTA
jgi:phosphonate metabolism protein PhnN/1,5-bisphosphokinase (PRPP-forming)